MPRNIPSRFRSISPGGNMFGTLIQIIDQIVQVFSCVMGSGFGIIPIADQALVSKLCLDSSLRLTIGGTSLYLATTGYVSRLALFVYIPRIRGWFKPIPPSLTGYASPRRHHKNFRVSILGLLIVIALWVCLTLWLLFKM